MKIGISMIYKRVDQSAPNPGAFAQECEQLGLESVWVGDHMLFHANPTTPFPAGGSIPDHYAHFPDPFIVLAMAAATTTKLKIRTRAAGCGENHRDARSARWRTSAPWRRRGVVARGRRPARLGLRSSLDAGGRIRRGDARAVVQARGVIPRQVR